MNRRVAQSLLLWLLPLLALRALVPAGFMLDTSHGGLSMVICSGGVFKTVHVDDHGRLVDGASAANTLQDGASKDEASQDHSSPSPCPFAMAASAPAPAPLVWLPQSVNVAPDLIRDDGIAISFGPTRAQQSRAPPYFS